MASHYCLYTAHDGEDDDGVDNDNDVVDDERRKFFLSSFLVYTLHELSSLNIADSF